MSQVSDNEIHQEVLFRLVSAHWLFFILEPCSAVLIFFFKCPTVLYLANFHDIDMTRQTPPDVSKWLHGQSDRTWKQFRNIKSQRGVTSICCCCCCSLVVGSINVSQPLHPTHTHRPSYNSPPSLPLNPLPSPFSPPPPPSARSSHSSLFPCGSTVFPCVKNSYSDFVLSLNDRLTSAGKGLGTSCVVFDSCFSLDFSTCLIPIGSQRLK